MSYRKIVYTSMLKLARFKATGFFVRIIIKVFRSSPGIFYVIASTSYRTNGSLFIAKSISIKGANMHADNYLILTELAECHQVLGEWGQANRVWMDVLRLRGDELKEKNWIKFSKALIAESKNETALFVTEEGLSKHPESLGLKIQLAKCYSVMNENTSASNAWGDLIKKNILPEIYLREAVLDFKESKQFNAFIEIYENSNSTVRDNVYAIITYGEALLNMDKSDEALDIFNDLDNNRSKQSLPISLKRSIQIGQSFAERLVNIDGYKKQIADYKKTNRKSEKIKIAVYTSYTKGYDQLKPHSVIDNRFDYYVYTDDLTTNDMGFYKILPLPTDHKDGRISTRYPKSHPHKLLKEYDVVVWLDTSIMLTGDIYDEILEFFNSKHAIASTPHSARDSILDELIACLYREKDSYENIRSVKNSLGEDDQLYNELSENGFLMFKPKDERLKKPLELWWKYITEVSLRDQLTFNYCLSKHKTSWHKLTKPPINIHNNPNFIIMPHKKEDEILKKLVDKL